MVQRAYENSSFPALLLSVTCFALFGALNFLHNGPAFSVFNIVLGIIAGLIFGFLSLGFMSTLLLVANGDLRRQYGSGFAMQAVSRGMLFMIPFAVLAVLAEVVLNWPAAMVFTSAGIMTAGASVGVEIGRLGKSGAKNFILPSIAAFLTSTLWMVMTGLLKFAGGVLKTWLGM